jgi:deoxyribonuclease-4
MSVAGGVHRAFERGASIGCTAMQIFVRNARQWDAKPILAEHVELFAAERRRTGIHRVVSHGSYLANLASADGSLRRKSIAAVIDELERSERLELDGLVLHPGSSDGGRECDGLRRIAEGLDEVFHGAPGFRCRVLLETMAGQGTNLGWRFEHLARIRDAVCEPERVGWCLDTCHVFAAGHDLRTARAVRATLDEFDRVCSLADLGAVHLNDSLVRLGKRRDRHAHIGEGAIGRAGFRAFLGDSRVREVPMVLETPKGEDLREDARNLEVLRALAARRLPPRRRPLSTEAWRRGRLSSRSRRPVSTPARRRGAGTSTR